MTLTELAAWTQPLYAVFEPLLIPLASWAAWAVVAELRRRGWQTTYAAAIPRAMGRGVLAAQKRGLDPFSEAGRAVVASEGTAYLARFVGEQAAKLAIPADTHGERVLAQLGIASGEAQAAVLATAATVASTLKPAAAMLEAATAISDAVGTSILEAAAARQRADAASAPPRGAPCGSPPNQGSSGSRPA